jgi:hypothetical protein
MRKGLARMLMAVVIGGALAPATSSAQGKSLHPPGAGVALSRRVAKGPAVPPPNNRGGRGFDMRVLRALHNFDNHVSLDPPLRPQSP